MVDSLSRPEVGGSLESQAAKEENGLLTLALSPASACLGCQPRTMAPSPDPLALKTRAERHERPMTAPPFLFLRVIDLKFRVRSAHPCRLPPECACQRPEFWNASHFRPLTCGEPPPPNFFLFVHACAYMCVQITSPSVSWVTFRSIILRRDLPLNLAFISLTRLANTQASLVL